MPPAGHRKPAHSHKHSFSGHLDSQWRAFQVSLFKPPPTEVLEGGAAASGSRQSSEGSQEPFLTMQDLQPSKETNEWLMVGLTLLPKISWWVGRVGDSGDGAYVGACVMRRNGCHRISCIVPGRDAHKWHREATEP